MKIQNGSDFELRNDSVGMRLAMMKIESSARAQTKFEQSKSKSCPLEICWDLKKPAIICGTVKLIIPIDFGEWEHCSRNKSQTSNWPFLNGQCLLASVGTH